jgi:hypothetical protein
MNQKKSRGVRRIERFYWFLIIRYASAHVSSGNAALGGNACKHTHSQTYIHSSVIPEGVAETPHILRHPHFANFFCMKTCTRVTLKTIKDSKR